MNTLIFFDIFMLIIYVYVFYLTVRNAIKFWQVEDSVEGQRNAFAIISFIAVLAIALFSIADIKLNLIPNATCDHVMPIWKDALAARVTNRILLSITVVMSALTMLGWKFSAFTKAFWRKKVKP